MVKKAKEWSGEEGEERAGWRRGGGGCCGGYVVVVGGKGTCRGAWTVFLCERPCDHLLEGCEQSKFPRSLCQPIRNNKKTKRISTAAQGFIWIIIIRLLYECKKNFEQRKRSIEATSLLFNHKECETLMRLSPWS